MKKVGLIYSKLYHWKVIRIQFILHSGGVNHHEKSQSERWGGVEGWLTVVYQFKNKQINLKDGIFK